jgi:dTMP kinase
LFIVFEGAEGCGKSTQARALYKHVLRSGISVTLTHEPGGTPLGKKMRHFLKRAREVHISPLAELFLFAASRAQLVTERIRPSLEKGTIVICDRYTHSTIAYQGYGRGLDFNSIQAMNTIATQGLKPDLTILLDISVQSGLARKKTAKQDRFENEEIAFHERVRKGYLEMAAADPQCWLVVDAALPKKEVERIIWERVEQLLHEKG